MILSFDFVIHEKSTSPSSQLQHLKAFRHFHRAVRYFQQFAPSLIRSQALLHILKRRLSALNKLALSFQFLSFNIEDFSSHSKIKSLAGAYWKRYCNAKSHIKSRYAFNSLRNFIIFLAASFAHHFLCHWFKKNFFCLFYYLCKKNICENIWTYYHWCLFNSLFTSL